MEEQRLILQYRSLVRFYVADISARVPPWVDRDDLTSAGMVGLLHALRNFDPDRGIAFTTYARLRIRGAVFDELRRAHPMSRAALRHGISVECHPADELDSADDTQIDAALMMREQSDFLHQAVDALPPRLRYVINGYYFEGRQPKDLAVDLGVSGPRISQLHTKALALLRDMPAEQGG